MIQASTEVDVDFILDVQFGKEYYVECSVGMGVLIGHPVFKLKDESVAFPKFKKIKKDDTE